MFTAAAMYLAAVFFLPKLMFDKPGKGQSKYDAIVRTPFALYVNSLHSHFSFYNTNTYQQMELVPLRIFVLRIVQRASVLSSISLGGRFLVQGSVSEESGQGIRIGCERRMLVVGIHIQQDTRASRHAFLDS